MSAGIPPVTGGMADVAARIAAIQARFAPAPVVATASGSSASASSSAFESALADAGGSSAAGTSAYATPGNAKLAGNAASRLLGTTTSGAMSLGASGAVPVGASGAAASAGATASPGAGAGPGSGPNVVAAAERYLGVPYLWGGTDPSRGLDCSGFAQRVYADLGYSLPRVSADQARAGRPVASLAEARPGDLIFFDNSSRRAGIDHVAIYAGNNQMIAAPRTGDVVKRQSVYSTPVAIRRVLPDPVAGTPAPGTLLTSAAPAAGSATLTGALLASAAPAGSTTSTAPAGSTTSTAPAVGATTAGGAFEPLFAAAGARHGVSPALLRAVAQVESGFDPRAVSRAGAKGLMQLMPGTAAGLGVDPFEPAAAVDGAARLLAGHLRRFGTVELALAAYNAGPGAVTRHGGVPPFAETRAYVRKVVGATGAAA